MEEQNEYNVFAHPLKFDELLQKVIFLRSYKELKIHILSRDGKMLGLSPGIKISVSLKTGHSTFVLSTVDVTALCDSYVGRDYAAQSTLPHCKWQDFFKQRR